MGGGELIGKSLFGARGYVFGTFIDLVLSCSPISGPSKLGQFGFVGFPTRITRRMHRRLRDLLLSSGVELIDMAESKI
jgi:hypothetical protein